VAYVERPEVTKDSCLAEALRNQRRASAQLVLAGCTNIGSAHSYIADLRTEIDQLGLTARTRWVGFIGDEELAALMRGAEALILPSVREGVGLPVIEAVTCGTPVIVTSASPMAAILGEAAISIDPKRHFPGWTRSGRGSEQSRNSCENAPRGARAERHHGLETACAGPAANHP
jgi:glycosyl transferase family 1